MSSDSTVQGWLMEDVTTSNITAELLLDNGTSLSNGTLARLGGGANAILAANTIKIIYLVIGQFHVCTLSFHRHC